jgi:hypothetical protein
MHVVALDVKDRLILEDLFELKWLESLTTIDAPLVNRVDSILWTLAFWLRAEHIEPFAGDTFRHF